MPRRCAYLEAGRGFGTTYETLGADSEMRYTLFTVASSRLTFEVTAPRRAPRLELGLAVLDAWRPATMRVAVVHRGSRTVLVDEEVDRAGWHDRVVDLEAWAGLTVELQLDTVAAAGSVALWSSPTIRGPTERPTRVLLILEDTLRRQC